MNRWWVVVLISGCAAAPMDPTQEADSAQTVDPFASGPLLHSLVAFDAGPLLVDGATGMYPVQVHGEATLPDGEAPFPLAILMHGRHTTCRYAPGAVGFEFLGHPCPDAPPALEPVDSYTGYRELAAMLASHGIAVVSVSANDVNDYDNPLGIAGDDYGATARARIVLEIVRGIRAGDTAYPFAPMLDTGRIGLMGHSRGGEGVARAAVLDAEGAGAGIDAVFALAPTDFARWQLRDVAFGTILPYCDGDVSNLQGAWMYDEAAGPKHQFLHMGANHNFYNSVWTGDDWGTGGDPYCGSGEAGTGRLAADVQRAQGNAIMAAFLRYYIGGETGLWSLLEGSQPLPFDAKVSADFNVGHSQHSLIANDGDARTWQKHGTQPTPCQGMACPIPETYSVSQQLHLHLGAGESFALRQPAGTSTTSYSGQAMSLRMGLDQDATAEGLAGLSVFMEDAAGKRFSWQLADHGLFIPPGDAAAKTTLNMVYLPYGGLDEAIDRHHIVAIGIAAAAEVDVQFADWYELDHVAEGPLGLSYH